MHSNILSYQKKETTKCIGAAGLFKASPVAQNCGVMGKKAKIPSPIWDL